VIVDTSALIAVLHNEPEAMIFATLLDAAPQCRMSAASFFETSIIVDKRRRPGGGRRFEDLLRELRMVIEPVTEEQVRVAREAYRDYGRGSGHPARLNFGDCFAYALARATGETLLFKGDDFHHTDIAPALA
jgi:ribonuclease VapC